MKKKNFGFFYILSILHLQPWYTLAEVPLAMYVMGLGGGWELGVTKQLKHNMASKRKLGKRSRFEVGLTDAG